MTIGAKGREELPSSVANAVFDQVRRMLPQGLDCELTLDCSLYEIGLDSMARMDVVNRLEETMGVRFSEDALADMETCRDLVEYIEASMSDDSPVPHSVATVSRPAREAMPSDEATPARQILPQDYDVTKFPECVAFRERLADAAAAGLENPFFRVKERVDKATATDRRPRGDQLHELRLPGHGRPSAGDRGGQGRPSTGSAPARRRAGWWAATTRSSEQLDEELAHFLGTEAAIAFPSGYGTNASLLGHLFGEEDLILYDELAHNSIVQGTFLSKARRRPFPHNDFEFLDRLLRDIRGKYRRVVVAIEGVYSMDGDYPDLPRFIEVKQRHRALLYVDEAHSIGVMGPTGRGMCEHFGVDPGDGDFWMGTISKALGSGGGYLAGRDILIQYLKYTTPAFVFATAISPANAAAALEAIRVIREEPERVSPPAGSLPAVPEAGRRLRTEHRQQRATPP